MLLSLVTRCRFAGVSKKIFVGRTSVHLQHGFIRQNANTAICKTKSSTSSRILTPSIKINIVHPCRRFQTTRPQNVNPVVLAILRPITKIAAVLVGRGFRKWWQSLSGQKRKLIIQHFKDNIRLYLFASVILASAGYSYYEDHITTTPFTGRKRFVIFTYDQLCAVSEEMYNEEIHKYQEQMMPANDPMVQQVTRVGNRLLQANKNLPQIYRKSWTVTVIDDPTVNCYVLPTGNIIMFKGMMDLLENDDQVAAVLGHEMSHAILEHAGEQLSHGYLLDMLILIPLAIIWAFMPNDGIAAVTHWFLNKVVTVLMQLPYSRIIEDEADTVGLQLAAKACYDVREASAFWGKMSVLDEIRKKSGENADVPEFLSTHPANTSRQQKIDSQMSDALELREHCQCPRLTDLDPRYSIRMMQKQLNIAPSPKES